jgi:hypothetical protein
MDGKLNRSRLQESSGAGERLSSAGPHVTSFPTRPVIEEASDESACPTVSKYVDLRVA